MKKLLVLATACAAAVVGFAKTITVTSTADEFPTKDGVLDPAQLTTGTLRWALANAEDGDTIDFDASLAGGTITVKGVCEVNPKQDASMLVNKGVTIVGPVGGITIDSNYKNGGQDDGGRLFNVPAGIASKVTFSGIRFYRGNGRGWGAAGNKNFPGGACYVGSPVKFVNCVFDECRNALPAFTKTGVDNGGGAILAAADLELDGCSFLGCGLNAGGNWGGAIMLAGDPSSPLVFAAKDTSFTDCYGYAYGGAMWIHTGVSSATFDSCSFVRCAIRANDMRGGAIYADPAAGTKVRFDDCVFRENSLYNQGWGGAIFGTRGKWVFNRCEFYRNMGAQCGGAIALREGANGEPECIAVNCTFCQNWCGNHGGAADVRNGSYFVNCTFAGNRVTNPSGSTASPSIYIASTCKLLNCCSVYAFNCNGWLSNSKDTPVPTGNFNGFDGGARTLVNCLTSDYMPVLDLDNEEQLRNMSSLFTGYEYWEYPLPNCNPCATNGTGNTIGYWKPENKKVTTPTITDDQKHPELPRVCGIMKGGLLDGMGYPVKANADFSYIAYSADNGATWTAFYGTDDGTAQLITADQRGVPYRKGKTPIGAATVESAAGSFIFIR